MDLKERLNNLVIDFTDAEYEDFVAWALKKMWNDYNQECMDKRIIIENKVKELPIVIKILQILI